MSAEEDDFELGWGDEDEPEQTATALDTVDNSRQENQAARTAAEIAAAVEKAKPGLDKIPDPVEPEGDGALTASEELRFRECDQGVDLGNKAWFIQGKALDTMAVGRLFRATRHKLEPERCYETIEEWAYLEKGISVSKCSQLRAAWPVGEVLAARKFDANPGQVREIVPVKNAYGLNAAVALYVLASEQAGAHKVTAALLRELVRLLPGNLELNEDDDVDVLAKTIRGQLVTPEQAQSTPRVPPAVTRAVDRRAVDLANALDRGRIPRNEVQLHLLQAFSDPDDTTVYNAVLERMKQDGKRPANKA
ncbi:hypothetical protein ACWGMW_07960 [Streptomyces albidoflavus]